MNTVLKYLLAALTALAINGVLPNSELWLDYIVGIKSIVLIILICLVVLTLLIKKEKESIPIKWFSLIITVSLIVNAILFGYVGYAVVSITGLIVILTYNKTIIKKEN